MLLDSNIIIYRAIPEFIPLLSPFTDAPGNSASLISKVEVLGFHRLSEIDKTQFHSIFESLYLIPVEVSIIEKAIELREQKKMSIGDAIIAATAVRRNLPVVTRNAKDFQWIDGLEVVNPFDE